MTPAHSNPLLMGWMPAETRNAVFQWRLPQPPGNKTPTQAASYH